MNEIEDMKFLKMGEDWDKFSYYCIPAMIRSVRVKIGKDEYLRMNECISSRDSFKAILVCYERIDGGVIFQ